AEILPRLLAIVTHLGQVLHQRVHLLDVSAVELEVLGDLRVGDPREPSEVIEGFGRIRSPSVFAHRLHEPPGVGDVEVPCHTAELPESSGTTHATPERARTKLSVQVE